MVFYLAGQLAETAPGNIQQARALAATISISSGNYAYAVLESRVRMDIVAENAIERLDFCINSRLIAWRSY